MKRKGIGIVPVGRTDERFLDAIAIALWAVFGLPVERLAPLPEPARAYDRARKQYSAPMILKALQEASSHAEGRTLGVTEEDLFIPMLSFVYGQAQVNGHLALLSTARLRQEFYGLPANAELTYSRGVKEAIHEMGHTFGLTHCPDPGCPMSLSNTIVQVDRKRDALCSSCMDWITEKERGLI
jgi:archaemetzincin